jgi:hypothetical protein
MQNVVKKGTFLLLITLNITALQLNAQQWTFLRNEVYFGLGASNFLGELGGANDVGTNGLKDLEFNMTRPTITLGYRFILNPYIGIRTGFTQGFVGGDDALTREIYRQNRNLNFKTGISELALNVEIYPFTERFEHFYHMKGASGRKNKYLSPYVTAGIGVFYFNPKGKYQGQWHALQPLRTEGQGLAGGPSPYKRVSICIPVGIGIKFSLNKNWSVGFEMAGRKTMTDYIDDVSGEYYDPVQLAQVNSLSPLLADPSLGLVPNATVPNSDGTGAQRGDKTDNDAYMFAILSVHYRLLKYRMHLPKY